MHHGDAARYLQRLAEGAVSMPHSGTCRCADCRDLDDAPDLACDAHASAATNAEELLAASQARVRELEADLSEARSLILEAWEGHDGDPDGNIGHRTASNLLEWLAAHPEG